MTNAEHLTVSIIAVKQAFQIQENQPRKRMIADLFFMLSKRSSLSQQLVCYDIYGVKMRPSLELECRLVYPLSNDA